jgi:endogenous inhibitor of DNA gyrase (YacG/DUF329 family)
MVFPCPICRENANREGNTYRPFCSERCQLLDLESWMSERYRVPVDEESSDREESFAEEEPSSSNENQ